MSNGNVTVETSNARREEFRRYLERTGVTEVLSDLLLSLYKKDDRPDDAFEYVRQYLSVHRKEAKDLSDIETLKKDLVEAKSKVKDLKKKINKLENKAIESNQINKINNQNV